MKIEEYPYIMKRYGDTPDGTVYYFSNMEEYGINFPFELYVPYKIANNPELIMAIKTPRSTNDISFNEAIDKIKKEGINPVGRMISYDFGNICLMPVIPRTNGIYSSYLGYNMYHNNFDYAYNASKNNELVFTKEDIDKYKDLHQQVYNMNKIAMQYIKNQLNIEIDDKIIINGYSAASKFSIFFSALHQDIVKGIIAGGTGGNNIIPDKSKDLNYPLGVSDIETFDFDTFKNMKQFYYIGKEDYNDSTILATNYELKPVDERKNENDIYIKDINNNKIPKRNDGIKSYHEEIKNGKKVYIQDYIPFDKYDFLKDENGNYKLAYATDGMYTLDQVEYIVKNIGSNPQERFETMKKMYGDYKINAIFNSYTGNHISVFDNNDLYNHIQEFMNSFSNIKKR